MPLKLDRSGAPLKAVLYLRQSTYREESISLELQETAGRDHAAKHGYTVVGVEQDPGISGRTWKRPAVQRVMQSIENGDVDVIVLWRWSRLSRSRKDWALAADRVDVAGGRIESATEPNDVTAAGRFARGVMTELAAFESERIGESWREVQTNRVGRGLPSGRVPWGWTHADGVVVPHPENAAVIPRLYEMYARGMGGRQIGDWLGANGYKTYYGSTKWNHSTVTTILDSPFHSGQVIYKGELFPGTQTPLVSVEEWERYRAMREERKSERAARHAYLLSGILTCSCGAPMFGFALHKGKRATDSYFGYRCREVSTNKDHGPGTISARLVDARFIEWLRSSAEMSRPVIQATDDHARTDTLRLAREITAIDTEVVKLTRQLKDDIVPERVYKLTVAELEATRASLVDQLAVAERAIVLTPERPQETAQKLIDEWDTEPLESCRAVIRSLVASMELRFGPSREITITPRGEGPVTSAI
jgi:site-specific DNA recombinase